MGDARCRFHRGGAPTGRRDHESQSEGAFADSLIAYRHNKDDVAAWRNGSARHQLSIEVPRRVLQHRHHDDEPQQHRDRSDDQAACDDQSSQVRPASAQHLAEIGDRDAADRRGRREYVLLGASHRVSDGSHGHSPEPHLIEASFDRIANPVHARPFRTAGSESRGRVRSRENRDPPSHTKRPMTENGSR
jgi:hypothetical protein